MGRHVGAHPWLPLQLALLLAVATAPLRQIALLLPLALLLAVEAAPLSPLCLAPLLPWTRTHVLPLTAVCVSSSSLRTHYYVVTPLFFSASPSAFHDECLRHTARPPPDPRPHQSRCHCRRPTHDTAHAIGVCFLCQLMCRWESTDAFVLQTVAAADPGATCGRTRFWSSLSSVGRQGEASGARYVP